VATIYLVRHGRTPANEKGILAGRTKGIFLDDLGILQAQEVAKKLQDIEFKKIIVSPMERCQQTARIILAGLEKSIKPVIESGINECNYGDWSNKKLSVLRKKPLWKTVQEKPSLVQFPNGEKMEEMLLRTKSTILETASKLKPIDNLLVVSHGDPIRTFVADCLGIHLDNFQRITIDPCSISIIKVENNSVQVVSINNRVNVKQPQKKRKRFGSDLGGGAG
jgi:probable phosphomutase (TIGR03848 family)